MKIDAGSAEIQLRPVAKVLTSLTLNRLIFQDVRVNGARCEILPSAGKRELRARSGFNDLGEMRVRMPLTNIARPDFLRAILIDGWAEVEGKLKAQVQLNIEEAGLRLATVSFVSGSFRNRVPCRVGLLSMGSGFLLRAFRLPQF